MRERAGKKRDKSRKYSLFYKQEHGIAIQIFVLICNVIKGGCSSNAEPLKVLDKDKILIHSAELGISLKIHKTSKEICN